MLDTGWPCPCRKARHGAFLQQQQQQRLHLAQFSRRHHQPARRLITAAAGSTNGTSRDSTPDRDQPPQQQPAPAAAALPQTSSTVDDMLNDAKQEFLEALQQLKDTAGVAFVPGYKPAAAAAAADSSSGRQQQQQQRFGRSTPRFTTYSNLREVAAAKQAAAEQQWRLEQQQQLLQQVPSLPDRLGRILMGRFLDRGSSSSSSEEQQQRFDARLAAMRFELQAQMLDQAQQQQQQQGQPQIINILPDGTAVTTDQELSPYKAAVAAAAAAADFTDPAAAPPPPAAAADEEPYPAVTNMLVLVMWAVFVLQWWPVLPELWLTVKKVGVLQGLTAVLLAFPDTPVTQALQLDFAAVQKWNLAGLVTSGFVHSGLAAAWLCTRALASCGKLIEFGLGPMQLIAIFIIASVSASVAHIVAGRSMVAVCGSGAVIGVFTTWTVLASKHLQGKIPMWTVYFQLGSLVALNLLLGLLQPAVGVASILGGMVGGVLAVKFAGPVALALQWSITLPVLATLFALKLAFDAAKGLLAAAMVAVVFVTQFVTNMAQAVRRV